MRLVLLAVMLLTSSIGFAKTGFEKRLQLAPFELQWMNHEDPSTIFRTSDFPGSVFLLEAYFKNCPYCNDNAPMVNQLREHFADRVDLQIVDLGRDCRDADYTSWISRHSPNHPVLRDCDMEVLGPLGVRAYPSSYILDCNLNVVRSHVGAWSNNTYRSIVTSIENLLAQGCQPEE